MLMRVAMVQKPIPARAGMNPDDNEEGEGEKADPRTSGDEPRSHSVPSCAPTRSPHERG